MLIDMLERVALLRLCGWRCPMAFYTTVEQHNDAALQDTGLIPNPAMRLSDART